ncbi:MAG: hypothetical protein WB765_07620 [Acidimicrobiales bacterium]|jgi:hypothetical protein
MTTTPKTPSATEPPDDIDADAAAPADPGHLGGIPMPEALPDSTFGQSPQPGPSASDTARAASSPSSPGSSSWW